MPPPDHPLHDARTLPPTPRRAVPFRPPGRPPVALLIVCDDGRLDGELVRVRGDRFVIGRTEGDLLLPHDSLVSARHAEIVRTADGPDFRWAVADLGSTNGLFVRVSKMELKPGAEILVGGGRYRFDGPRQAIAAAPHTGTIDWTAPPPDVLPALVEMLPGGDGPRRALERAEYWIGADPTGPFPRPHDPYCEWRHARLFRHADGRWFADHPKTRNGLWKRVARVAADRPIQFQVGGQRFRLRPGS